MTTVESKIFDALRNRSLSFLTIKQLDISIKQDFFLEMAFYLPKRN